MQPHEHLNLALGMVEAAMRRPHVDHIDATVGTEIPREPDPWEQLRAIAATHSADPVLANFEGAVRDALTRLDDRRDDPLADRFEVTRASDGIVDVDGAFTHAGSKNSDEVVIAAQTAIGWRDLRVSRKVAMEIRDALVVLLDETRRNTPE